MDVALNEVVIGPPEVVCNGPYRVESFEKLQSGDITSRARRVLPAYVVRRLHRDYSGWRLEMRVETDPVKLSVKHVHYVVVLADQKQANRFRVEFGTDLQPDTAPALEEVKLEDADRHPFDVVMDNLSPMREELERRWAVRNQRRDPDYKPSTGTSGRWLNRLRAEMVMSRYIRRFLGIQDPDGHDQPIPD